MCMDADKIFNLFDDSEDSKPNSDYGNDLSYILENYKEHPIFWVGLIKKLKHNHKVFNSKVRDFFTDMDEELVIYDVETA